MNCEKCKNKKATVFFADDGGSRHALCASCGAIQGKLGQITSNEKSNETNSPFLILKDKSFIALNSPVFVK